MAEPIPSTAPAVDAAPSRAWSERDETLDLAVRHAMQIGLLSWPVTVALALFFAGETTPAGLAVWIAWGALATVLSSLSLRTYFAPTADGSPRRPLSTVIATAVASGALWGWPTFLMEVRDDGPTFLFLLFPFAASLVNVILAAPSRLMFLTFQLSLLSSVSIGLMSNPTDVGVGVLGAAWAWFLVSLALHQLVHRDSLAAVRLRHRTDELVDRLEDERQQLAAANAQLQHQATHDPLTDLPNRRGVLSFLDRVLDDAIDGGHQIGVVYLDLDRFKAINDGLGHRAGDVLLQVVSDRLRRVLPLEAVAGRLGGDEILVVLPHVESPAEIEAAAGRIARAIAEPIHLEGREVSTSTSMGLALGPTHGATGPELVRSANAALHRAKASGRNRWQAFDDQLRERLARRVDDEQALRRALDHGEIVPFFQPEVDAATGRVVGAEVLARWLRRDGTTLPAASFIGLAKEVGVLPRLQQVVVSQARPAIRRLGALGLPDGFRFRVNLSPRPAGRAWEPDLVRELVAGIPVDLLTLDITEQLVLDDVPRAAGALATLRAEGVHIGLDNFGRGASAITLLRRLPLDEVRIDRETIEGITTHPHDRAIVRSIVALVRELGLSITAEGIETAMQADALLALGCPRQAGHLYAAALPTPAFERYLIERELQANSTDGATNWSTEHLS
jgi:diguanylate cyclase (GGDEF)-like protein